MNLIHDFFSGPLLIPSVMLLTATLWGVISSIFMFDSHGGGSALDHSIGVPSAEATMAGSHAASVQSTDILPTDVSQASGHQGLPSGGGHASHEGLLAAITQWLNVRDMPLMFWMAVFAAVWWIVSAIWWLVVDRWILDEPGVIWSSILMFRNLLCSLPITKLATIPLKGWEYSSHLDARSLIGRECEISSSEASPTFGQVKFKTDGAPLLLNVRTDGAYLAKGARVWITHYDPVKRIYLVLR